MVPNKALPIAMGVSLQEGKNEGVGPCVEMDHSWKLFKKMLVPVAPEVTELN